MSADREETLAGPEGQALRHSPDVEPLKLCAHDASRGELLPESALVTAGPRAQKKPPPAFTVGGF